MVRGRHEHSRSRSPRGPQPSTIPGPVPDSGTVPPNVVRGLERSGTGLVPAGWIPGPAGWIPGPRIPEGPPPEREHLNNGNQQRWEPRVAGHQQQQPLQAAPWIPLPSLNEVEQQHRAPAAPGTSTGHQQQHRAPAAAPGHRAPAAAPGTGSSTGHRQQLLTEHLLQEIHREAQIHLGTSPPGP
jgi:hypothetical protein